MGTICLRREGCRSLRKLFHVRYLVCFCWLFVVAVAVVLQMFVSTFVREFEGLSFLLLKENLKAHALPLASVPK